LPTVSKSLKNIKLRWKLLLFILSALITLNIYYLFTTPTKDGPWKTQYEKVATVKLDNAVELNDLVELNEVTATIRNFRRARYFDSGATKEINWSERKVNLDELKSVWYGISIFSSPGLAHTFLSFDFGDEDPVVISVEARMRPEQQYSPLKGALDNYHLIYVIADERDIIGVRTHKRSEEVYFMPIVIDKKRRQKLFVDMINRANSLDNQPEFYNTFSSNCTNSIMRETKISAWQYYLDPRIILPGFSDRIAYQYGVLDQNYSREVLRDAAHIQSDGFTDDDPNFYSKIRNSYYQKLEAAKKQRALQL